jgi:hypothetical protein
VGDCRVGCIGRRSPGRRGGRLPIGAPGRGRGRWKMGCPGTGRPGAGRAGAPDWAAEGGACGGALYTGRGPVCGTIIRRCGGAGADGLVAGGVGGVACAGGDGATGSVIAGGTAAAGGCERGGATVEAVAEGTVGGTGASGGAGGGCTGAGGLGCGTTSLGVGVGAAGFTGGAGGAAGVVAAGAAGFFSTTAGGALGRGGGATAADCCFVMSFRTSPGLEICERSILVLISSPSDRAARAGREPACDSAAAWKWARTFTASCSSMELECVFFSVTPTSGSTSRIALLLTSSSLARSLIRILLIRPLFPPPVPSSLHSNLTASVLS